MFYFWDDFKHIFDNFLFNNFILNLFQLFCKIFHNFIHSLLKIHDKQIREINQINLKKSTLLKSLNKIYSKIYEKLPTHSSSNHKLLFTPPHSSLFELFGCESNFIYFSSFGFFRINFLKSYQFFQTFFYQDWIKIVKQALNWFDFEMFLISFWDNCCHKMISLLFFFKIISLIYFELG